MGIAQQTFFIRDTRRNYASMSSSEGSLLPVLHYTTFEMASFSTCYHSNRLGLEIFRKGRISIPNNCSGQLCLVHPLSPPKSEPKFRRKQTISQHLD